MADEVECSLTLLTLRPSTIDGKTYSHTSLGYYSYGDDFYSKGNMDYTGDENTEPELEDWDIAICTIHSKQ